MEINDTREHSAAELTCRLRANIERQRLKPGDRYLTTREAAERFEVSPATAGRAMRLLADQNVLRRQRRLGTRIGPRVRATTGQPTGVRSLQVLVPSDLDVDYAIDDLVQGIHQVNRSASVQLNFLPDHEPLDYLQDLLGSLINPRRLVGILAISSPRKIYRALADLDVPVIVLGSVFPEAQALPSVDVDNHRIGQLLVEFALQRASHPTIVSLLPQTWTAGDNALMKGATGALRQARMSADVLVVRALPDERAIVEAETLALLQSEKKPIVFFCRHRLFADITAQVIERSGLRMGRDAHVICDACPLPDDRRLPFPCFRGEHPYREAVATATRMLWSQAEGRELEQRHILVPVRFCDSVFPALSPEA